MSNELVRIKRAVLAGNYVFTEKAQCEMDIDGLSEMDVLESIVGAGQIDKRMNSTSVRRGRAREQLYVIVNRNLAGVMIYTKGKLSVADGNDTFYVLISSKRSE